MDSVTNQPKETNYSDVQPGDRLIFERPGGIIYGGAVWQSPTTGDIIAGDTFLTLEGQWLPEPTGEVTMTLDSSHRRDGETWKGERRAWIEELQCGGGYTNCRNDVTPPIHSEACPISESEHTK